MKKGIEKSNSCDGKTRFDSKELANDAATQINTKSGKSHRVVTYRCGFCQGYHFGHENKKKKPLKDKPGNNKIDVREYKIKQSDLTKGYCIIKQTA